MSEVFVRMLRADPPLSTVEEVHWYVLRAIERRFFEQRRRRKVRQHLIEALEREAADVLSAFLQEVIAVGEEIDRQRFYEAVSRHLKRLPPTSRAAIELYFFAEPKRGYRELAERLGIRSASAAYERVQKALAELRTAL